MVDCARMTGTILNAAAILIGGVLGLTTRKQMTAANQGLLKVILGVLVVYVGLGMVWESLNGSFTHRVKQMVIVILALTLGRIAGQTLHLQKSLNRLGKIAKEKFSNAKPGSARKVRRDVMPT